MFQIQSYVSVECIGKFFHKDFRMFPSLWRHSFTSAQRKRPLKSSHQVLNINFHIWPISNQRATQEKKKKIPLNIPSGFNWTNSTQIFLAVSIQQHHGGKNYPHRVQKILSSQDPELLPKITKRKEKGSDDSRES